MNIAVFNEYIHERESDYVGSIYPEGIHGLLAKVLSEGNTVRCFTLDNVDELTDETLAETDVLIWWGHIGHHLVPDEVAERVRNAVLSGMGFIPLHSAHHSKPFKLLMGTPCNLGWRERGDWERLWICNPGHPIAKGLGRFIELSHEEVYVEPFMIPEPDVLVFVGAYEGGEAFRSGCCYRRGYGKIFYFQPGHETYPTFHNPDVQKVIRNAVEWAYPDYRGVLECPQVPYVEVPGADRE